MYSTLKSIETNGLSKPVLKLLSNVSENKIKKCPTWAKAPAGTSCSSVKLHSAQSETSIATTAEKRRKDPAFMVSGSPRATKHHRRNYTRFNSLKKLNHPWEPVRKKHTRTAHSKSLS